MTTPNQPAAPTQAAAIRRKERRDKIRTALVSMRLDGLPIPAKFPRNLGQLYNNSRRSTWQQDK